MSKQAIDPAATDSLAILTSGGLDSAILLGTSLSRYAAVYPLYVRQGLYWEDVELAHLLRFLDAVQAPSLKPLHVLTLPVGDLYDNHWSVRGEGVPDAESPDEAVFLPGRNVLLLSKAILWCHLHAVPAVALGTLASNPFPDATSEFFSTFQDVVNRAIGGKVQVLLPFAGLHKIEVMHQGRGLPLELSFSCMRPVDGRQCGQCNKCAEWQKAMAAIGKLA